MVFSFEPLSLSIIFSFWSRAESTFPMPMHGHPYSLHHFLNHIHFPLPDLIKVYPKHRLQFLPPDRFFIIQKLAFAYQFPANLLLDDVLCLIEIVPGLLAIGPEVLKRFPVAIAPVMIFSAGVLFMEALHFDYLEVFLQVFNEALKEYFESLRFSQVKPGCVGGADCLPGCCPIVVFGVCSTRGEPLVGQTR
jgi:hypothetical protein